MSAKRIVLDVQNLSVKFRQYDKGTKQMDLPVIRDLSVQVAEGEIVAVVGSSGSGKSLLAHAVLDILPYNAAVSGTIRYDGEILTKAQIKKKRGNEMVLVPQSVAYLDPLMKIGKQIGKNRQKAFSRYDLDAKVEELYPFELSGGMARRVLISTAVVENPRLVIADEPTPGLHLAMAKQILQHFREMADEGAGVMLITHDLELAIEVVDRIVVFYAGTTVEEAKATQFESEETLYHPYSKALWRALPQNGFLGTEGVQPYAGDYPTGCSFGPRCEHYSERCAGEIPYVANEYGFVRCVLEEAE